MVIKRLFTPPKRSFLLLGPRGTGKSTLVRRQIPFDLEIDLLRSKTFLPLSANPSLLEEWTDHLKPGAWIFIDEIQKIPALMDEVHALYEKKRFNFALSGSSARKLKRGGANLLAGRALSTHLFPFTFSEFKPHYSIDDAIAWGSLPQVVTEPEFRSDFLSTYVETYLREELLAEGIVRKLEPFSRFLQVTGLYNGQVLNIENIARESHVKRTTVDKYFEVLEETLIGFRLPAYQPKWNAKEFAHPKFYLFDAGVARGCAGFLNEEPDPMWFGFAFESLVINEVRAFNHYLKANRFLSYYKYANGYEIDLIIENKKKSLSKKQEVTAIEIKYATKWDKRWSEPLFSFAEKSKDRVKRLIGVYRGEKRLEFGELTVYPIKSFLEKLSKGEFF